MSLKKRKNVESCDKCNGNAQLEPLELSDYSGTKCGICMEVIEYSKEKPKEDENNN